MPRSLVNILLLAALLPLAACSSKKAPAPQPPAAAPAENPAPAAPAQPQPPKAAGFEGRWKGNSGEDLPFEFTVKGDKISDINAGYRVHKEGGCTASANFTIDGTATLSGKSFSLEGTKDLMGDLIGYKVSGNFTSDQEASGTVQWKANSKICGDVSHQANWTAKKSAATEDAPDAADEN